MFNCYNKNDLETKKKKSGIITNRKGRCIWIKLS